VPEELISHMRARVEQCRRLAEMITDERAAAILRQMAEEAEADLRRLEAGQAQKAKLPPQT
jgi:predicted DNA-binding protein (UPF0278 family)